MKNHTEPRVEWEKIEQFKCVDTSFFPEFIVTFLCLVSSQRCEHNVLAHPQG